MTYKSQQIIYGSLTDRFNSGKHKKFLFTTITIVQYPHARLIAITRAIVVGLRQHIPSQNLDDSFSRTTLRQTLRSVVFNNTMHSRRHVRRIQLTWQEGSFSPSQGCQWCGKWQNIFCKDEPCTRDTSFWVGRSLGGHCYLYP